MNDSAAAGPWASTVALSRALRCRGLTCREDGRDF